MPGHLNRLLSKRICDRPFVETAFPQNDCYSVSKAVQRQTRADLAGTL